VVSGAGFLMAWIGESRPDGRVVPVAQAGEVRGYLDEIEIRTDASTPAGLGPAGTALRERRTVVAHDIGSEPSMAPWRLAALARGYHAAAAVPLVSGDRLFGVLIVYAGDPRLLQGESVPLIEKLARNLAYSLDVVDLGARHRETTLALSVSEEQLRQAQKMEAIGRLAGGIAHDFNNLLMVIAGYADVALAPKTDEPRRRRSIEEILTAADRATELTRQLVAFSRKQVLQPKVLDLNVLVGRVESLLRRLMPENIRITVEAEPGLRSVRADPSQMEQVVLNLAVNARDAMPDGGTIVIDTGNATLPTVMSVAAAELPPGDYVVVSVKDSGEGMSPEVMEHLFEPFFTTKETGKGSGLGLSMVYGIVRQSGGGIVVESAVGEGSTFRVYLPAFAAPAVEQAESQPAPGSNRGSESVLVVEDNEAVRSFVLESLRDAGYRVTDAASPGPALERLKAAGSSFDLLLTDLVLPETDGYELASLATAARPGLRVVYMTGYSDNPKIREEAFVTGIDLLEKPFSAATLTAKVREVLDRRPAAH
ncbi:MAG: Blue-light-activated protein, partial [Acidobacteria bacterium]|nr:Blue-light-activated protein [Acidobacteriota bacterium]